MRVRYTLGWEMGVWNGGRSWSLIETWNKDSGIGMFEGGMLDVYIYEHPNIQYKT